MSHIPSTEDATERHRDAIATATEDATFEAWIDGEWFTPPDGSRFETRSPVTDQTITTLPRCGPDTVDAAVDAAGAAFDGAWGSLHADERSDLLLEWVAELRDAAEELALLECLDVGKPLANAEYEVGKALDYVEYYAHLVRGGRRRDRGVRGRSRRQRPATRAAIRARTRVAGGVTRRRR